jgi:HSP20 family protein
MTFYLHPYPYRQMARRVAQRGEQTLGINIREEDEAYILSALVPGLNAEDLNIQVLEDVLRIEGEFQRNGPADKADEQSYLVRELPNGSFTRTLRLPSVIDKAESARPRKISVKSK